MLLRDLLLSVPEPVRSRLSKRLESLILTIDVDKVADIKATISLLRDFKSAQKKD